MVQESSCVEKKGKAYESMEQIFSALNETNANLLEESFAPSSISAFFSLKSEQAYVTLHSPQFVTGHSNFQVFFKQFRLSFTHSQAFFSKITK